MPSEKDLQAIDAGSFQVIFDGVDLGFTTVGSQNFNINEGKITVDNLDQTFGQAVTFSQGFNITFTVTFAQGGAQYLAEQILQGKAEKITGQSGIRHVLRNQFRNEESLKKVLRLHPDGLDATDFSEDIFAAKAIIDLTGLSFITSRDEIRQLPVTFQIFPDPANNNELLSIGDFTQVQVDPTAVWLAAGNPARCPSTHLGALTLGAQDTQLIDSYAGYLPTTPTFTALANGGATATATTFDIDAISVSNLIAAGNYAQIGSEVIYIEAVNSSTSTTANITVVRGIWGTIPAVIADDAAISLYVDQVVTVDNVRITGQGNYASSSPANVTVGNVFQTTDETELKGVIAHVASGSANITVSVTGQSGSPVTSPNLVVTAS